jgi:hypothetical protein
MNDTDLERDACDVIEFFIALARQDADLVAEFLKSAGVGPGDPLPQNALLKLGLYRRLSLWEEIGLTSGCSVELPTAHAVFADLVAELEGEPPRFEIMALSRQIHSFAQQRLTWPQSGAATFFLDDRGSQANTLDCVAELLWTFRHLADAGSSSPPASPLGNLGDASRLR